MENIMYRTVERMNVATALNSQYTRYTYVMLTSLFANNADLEIYVYLLHSDLTEEDEAYFEALAEEWKQRIFFLQIDASTLPAGLPETSWPPETYFRLMLLDNLPHDVDRLLYLDGDMIINKPIKKMYFTDFDDKLFCVCRDGFVVSSDASAGGNEIFKEIEKQDDFIYFNAGMMLWNIEAMRGKYCFKIYMDLAKELDFKMQAPDQDLLNYMHWQQVKFLDEYQYNFYARLAYNLGIRYEEVKRETSIVHFVGKKPWQGGDYAHYDIEQLWWDYAKLTPFYVELMEEFLQDAISNPFIHNVIIDLMSSKKQLTNELEKSVALCQKLAHIIENPQ